MPLDTWLQTAYAGTGASNVFAVEPDADEVTDVFIGLVDGGSSASTYSLYTLNQAKDTWVAVPGATQLSIAGTKSMLATLPGGHYCLAPGSEEPGAVDIKVGGRNVTLDVKGISASF
jgi:hypothetical protein